MKKSVLLGICAFISIMSTAQNVMVIENKDHTTTKVAVDKILRVYFEQIEFKFDKEKVSLLEGDQVQLNLINNTGKDVIWSSSNTSVATVDNTGNITALSAGTAW